MTNKRTDHGYFAPGNVGGASLLTRERLDRIVELVRAGNFLSTAARAVGVNPRTLRKWLKRGQEHAAEKRETVFAKLYRQVDGAAAQNEAELVASVKLAGVDGVQGKRFHRARKVLEDGTVEVVEHTEITSVAPDWRASVKLLEARSISRFGNRKADVQITTNIGVGSTLQPEDLACAQRMTLNRPVKSLPIKNPDGSVTSVPAGFRFLAFPKHATIEQVMTMVQDLMARHASEWPEELLTTERPAKVVETPTLPALPPGRDAELLPVMAEVDAEVAGDDGDITPQPRRRVESMLTTPDRLVSDLYRGLDEAAPPLP